MTNRSARMGEMPIPQLMIRISTPLMLSMVVQALYNIVDSMFVAQYHPEGLTAVSLAFPVQQLMIALGVGTGVGLNSLISRRLGEGRPEEARKAANNGIFLAVLSWVIFLAFGLLFARPFFAAYTSDPMVLAMGGDYLWIVTVFSLPLFIQLAIEKVMQGTGNTMAHMITMVSGAVTNIILDPLLIFGWGPVPSLGVAGAAIATVIGQTVSMGVGIWLNQTRNRELALSWKGFRPEKKIIRDIYIVGFPSIIMQSIGSVMTVLMNGILIAFGNAAVSVLGIYSKLQSFIFMPVFGLTNGLVAIVGYNYGARLKQRVYEAIRTALIFAGVIMLVGTILFMGIPGPLLSLFEGGDAAAADQVEAMYHIGIPALRIISIGFLGAAVGIIYSTVFQAVGNGFLSLIISVCRQLVVLLPAAWVLARWGVNAVWWSFPIAEVVSLILSLIAYRWADKKYLRSL